MEDFKQAWKQHLGLDLAGESPKPGARRGRQPEAQASEITNKIAVCSTVSLDADLAVSPAADNPKSKIKNLKSRIACSPECELKVGSGKLKAQDSGSANLPIQQLRQRMEALMRELSPLFAQRVPLGSSRNAVKQPENAPPEKSPAQKQNRASNDKKQPTAKPAPVPELAASGQQLAASSSQIKNQPSEESLGHHNGTPDQRCGDVFDDRFQVAFGLKR
ncbi:MAG TPA: hypothetical protein VKY85_13140 [Candidatus Angelobacter sp.]|nr:hypothetical protein [Candidatus Angelobacter sp.]